MPKNQWSSRFAFILTTSAFAVGLGNIWRFPYIVGESGGGAFLIIYLILIFLVGIPLMIIEMGLGRMSQTTPLLGFGKLSNKPVWNGLGWLGVLACLMIMSYYVMIMAWIVIYFQECINGNIGKMEIAQLPGHFSLIASNHNLVIWVIVSIMIAATLIIRKGLKNGLERSSKYMMLALIIIIFCLTIWAATLEEALAGYRWFLTPDFSKIDVTIILSALGQLFFSIGIGMAIAFAFGSYTTKNDNLISSTTWIVLTDSIFAVLAGLMIFPIIFSFNLSPDSGPNLIFITMASAFGKMEYGEWIGAIFFLLLFLAGFTSLVSSVQGIKDSFKDKFRQSDMMALLITSGIITLGSVPVVYSYTDQPFLISGMHMFDFLDFMTNSIMLPLGGFLIAIFGAYVVGFEQLKKHLEQGNNQFTISYFWKFVIKLIIPIGLFLILLRGLL